MHNIADYINSLQKENVSFFAYHLPASDYVRVGWQDDKINNLVKLDDMLKSEGFVMSPFLENESNPLLFIRQDHHIDFHLKENENSLIGEKDDSLWGISDDNLSLPVFEKDDYLKNCNAFINQIKMTELKKAILSRVVRFNKSYLKNAGILFQNLKRAYPNAFVFFVFIPGQICWNGDTPETLLEMDKGKLTTMSLAGTQRWIQGVTDNLDNWGKKEKEEQAFVTMHIGSMLEKNGIHNIQIEPLTVERAGNIAHLKTLFHGEVDSDPAKIAQLISELSPTPAVCGSPRDEALQLIQKTEQHDRSYYAGFLGPINGVESLRLFVNLRSASLTSDSTLLYVGGGITADSDPEQEWEETILKSQTILNVLNQ